MPKTEELLWRKEIVFFRRRLSIVIDITHSSIDKSVKARWTEKVSLKK